MAAAFDVYIRFLGVTGGYWLLDGAAEFAGKVIEAKDDGSVVFNNFSLSASQYKGKYVQVGGYGVIEDLVEELATKYPMTVQVEATVVGDTTDRLVAATLAIRKSLISIEDGGLVSFNTYNGVDGGLLPLGHLIIPAGTTSGSTILLDLETTCYTYDIYPWVYNGEPGTITDETLRSSGGDGELTVSEYVPETYSRSLTVTGTDPHPPSFYAPGQPPVARTITIENTALLVLIPEGSAATPGSFTESDVLIENTTTITGDLANLIFMVNGVEVLPTDPGTIPNIGSYTLDTTDDSFTLVLSDPTDDIVATAAYSVGEASTAEPFQNSADIVTTPPGTSDTLEIRWRDEGGAWSSWKTIPVGNADDKKIMYTIYQLGMYFERQYEVRFNGTSKLVLAYLEEETGVLG